MSCIRRSFTRAITYAILMSTVFADVVTLKSGEKIEGKITKETDQQVTLEIKVGGGVFDERIIPRGEIDHIDKVSPEMEAFKAIMTIQPGTNSFTSTQYDPSIRALEAYLKQYPNGGHTAEVQAVLNEFLAEKKRVEAGEAKLHGEWLSKAEVEKEKVQIGGLLSYENMKALSAARDDIGALNAFVAMEKNYSGSASMPEAVELAKKLMAAVKPAVERAIPEQKLFKAQKEKGFAEAGAADRPDMIAAYKADMAQAEAVAAAADKAGQWPPFIPTNDKALTILLTRIGREQTRLLALPVDNMRKSLELTNTAKKDIESRDLDNATKNLKEATTLWPTNELAKRLTADVAALKAAAKPSTPAPETPKPATTPTPKPSAAIKAAAPATPEPEDPTPFYMTIPGAIGIVVGIAAILVGVNVFKKMKAKKANGDVEIQ